MTRSLHVGRPPAVSGQGEEWEV